MHIKGPTLETLKEIAERKESEAEIQKVINFLDKNTDIPSLICCSALYYLLGSVRQYKLEYN